MNGQISGWMDANKFRSLDDFRGKLNYANYDRPAIFERTQFMKYFSSFE
jgi:dihydroorotate dehydrogenase (fumarate)